MTIRTIIITAIMALGLSASAQYKSVVYDLEKNFFNEGQPLPFETHIMLNGQVPSNVDLIELQIMKGGDIDGVPLYRGEWKRTSLNQTIFNLPVNYKLRQNNEYGLKISYYLGITSEEKSALYRILGTSVMTYLDQSVSIKGNDIKMSKSSKKVHEDLDAIVGQGLLFYQNDLAYEFPGFSDIIEEKLKEFEQLNLKENKFYQFRLKEDSTYNKRFENHAFFQKNMNELKKLIDSELIAYINTVSYVTAEVKKVDSYATEKGQFILPVNIGYGAIYNSGGFENLSYGQSSYLGLSFPLGNSALKSNLLSNSSIYLGAYLSNFDDENGEEITGPFIGRPLFLGVGTRAFKLLRANVGVTALQKDASESNFDVSQIYVRPSINLSFELGLWIGQLK
ncbi:MAG: hypothetical protein HKO93_07025 [Flavobacteriales bacterium]|nr:hypothetical protein [Flavobacteriales bacterium]